MSFTAEQIELNCRTLIPLYDPWRHSDAYYFDVVQAKRACDFFFELLTLTTDRFAGQPFDLLGWMSAIVGNIHGWRRKSDGLRRYRKALISTARKSSKSHLAAGLGLYHEFADGEADPSIVCAAGNSEQASIIYGIASRMVENEPELANRAEVMARAIRNKENGGKLRFINSAAKTKHGSNESLCIIDELHVVEDASLADTLESSMGTRQQPLTIYTTTAGTDPGALWAEIFDYAHKVQTGIIDDPEFLPGIWQALPDDDIKDPATWRKAQPSLGVTVGEDWYREGLKKALEVPRFMPVFKQLYLNMPTEDFASWIPFESWKACAGKVEPAENAICYAGCDLASTQDTTAVVLAFPVEDTILVKPFIFLPQSNAGGLFRRGKRDKAPYEVWAKQGHIILTPGNVIDFDAVADLIIEQSKKYTLREVQMDPHAASSIATKLQAAGITVTYARQGWSLAQACREVERLILSRKIIHPNNLMYSWQWSNASVHTDRGENIWPDKKRSTSRIDAPVATIMAVNAAKFGTETAGKENAPWQGEVVFI